ncbi:hypothetical protein H0H87_008869 [Tephrocybe sp. NHM501043]|nr:hypothetical protein H0H87_008869 [Tephrocybe sp. NHM501043]
MKIGQTQEDSNFAAKKFKILEDIIKDTLEGDAVLRRDSLVNMHYRPLTTSAPANQLLSLVNGRPVLKVKDCRAVDPNITPPAQDHFVGTGAANNDNDVLRLIQDNPDTSSIPANYYWAYSVITHNNVKRLYAVQATSSYLKKETGSYAYLVAVAGPCIFRNMAEVTASTS